MSMNYIKILEDGSTIATTDTPTFGEVSTTGDYLLNGLWYDSTGVLYTEQFTYLSKGGKLLVAEIANGVPVDIHYTELAPTLVEDTIKVSNLVVTDGFDLGQSWVNVTSERTLGVTYTNDTGKPIVVYWNVADGDNSGQIVMRVDGIAFSMGTASNAGYGLSISVIVPQGSTYIASLSGNITEVVTSWKELR